MKRYVIGLVLSLLFIEYFLLYPSTGLCQKSALTLVRGVRGEADISRYPQIYRDMAILIAKRNALESQGIIIDSQTLVDMGRLLDEIIKVETFGFIEKFHITSEENIGNTYQVIINAWVRTGKEREKTTQELLSQRNILMVARGEGSHKIGQVLKNKLADLNYSVFDSEFLWSRLSAQNWEYITLGEWKSLDESLYKFRADYLLQIKSDISYSQDNYGIKSFNANADIGLTQISTGKMKSYVSKEGIIFGLSKAQALNGNGKDQLEKRIAQPLCSDFLERLGQLFAQSERDIQVTIYGLRDKQEFDEFRDMLKSLRLGVKEVSNERYHEGTGTLLVRFDEKSIYLAGMIAFRDKYKILSYSWDSLEVQMNK